MTQKDKPLVDLNENLQSNYNTLTFQKGENLFEAGNEVDGLYFIESGKVKVYRMDANREEEILRIAEKGDFVGYRGFLTDSRHEANAKALETTMTILIPKEKFKDAMES